MSGIAALQQRLRDSTKGNAEGHNGDCWQAVVVLSQYEELLYAVGKKWPGETRRQTALRYIRQAELREDSVFAGDHQASTPHKTDHST